MNKQKYITHLCNIFLTKTIDITQKCVIMVLVTHKCVDDNIIFFGGFENGKQKRNVNGVI